MHELPAAIGCCSPCIHAKFAKVDSVTQYLTPPRGVISHNIVVRLMHSQVCFQLNCLNKCQFWQII